MRQLREAEKGLEAAVGAELNIKLRFPPAGDGQVKGLQDLRGERGAGDGAHGVRGVVGEVELVRVGECAELKEGVVGEDVRRVDGGVVDCGDVDEVVNLIAISSAA